MRKLKLALDWTPNVNHIGFYVAQEKGFFEKYGIEVEIIDTSSDNYELTPTKKVELGMADIALCPTESILSYRTKTKPFDLIAIGAILQEDLSAIAVLKDSEIRSPKDLDGKIYSSYKARYEDGIVREMIKNDGGIGNINIIYPNKLGIWNTLLNKQSHSTWIFLNWEGIEVEAKGIECNYFRMKDFGIPYSYSPVIATSESKLLNHKTDFASFMNASRDGFLYSKNYKEESVSILDTYIKPKDKNIDLLKALKMTAPCFGNRESWGKIDLQVLMNFKKWLKTKKLETRELKISNLYNNQFH